MKSLLFCEDVESLHFLVVRSQDNPNRSPNRFPRAYTGYPWGSSTGDAPKRRQTSHKAFAPMLTPPEGIYAARVASFEEGGFQASECDASSREAPLALPVEGLLKPDDWTTRAPLIEEAWDRPKHLV
jgi:hypothetical protein